MLYWLKCLTTINKWYFFLHWVPEIKTPNTCTKISVFTNQMLIQQMNWTYNHSSAFPNFHPPTWMGHSKIIFQIISQILKFWFKWHVCNSCVCLLLCKKSIGQAWSHLRLRIRTLQVIGWLLGLAWKQVQKQDAGVGKCFTRCHSQSQACADPDIFHSANLEL